MESLWESFGFRENPYATVPISPTAEGERLLVGRGRELHRLLRDLASLDTHVTIEGDNGVGKTSLVAVSSYLAQQDFLAGRASTYLIPMPEPFQLTAEETTEDLVRRVYRAVAREYIDAYGNIEEARLRVPERGTLNEVKKWLDSPTLQSIGGGFSLLGSGASASAGSSLNTSDGFAEQGFRQLVDGWLRLTFPNRSKGGFVCVLDNLELLETSKRARTMLESLRDTVLGRPGLIWVLCGARGIMRSSASSPRLAARLAQPIELEPIPDALVTEVVERRIEAYRVSDSVYVPVDAAGFEWLYDLVNRNLRSALSYCQQFAGYVHDLDPRPIIAEDRLKCLKTWFGEMAHRYAADAASSALTPRPWKLFDDLCAHGGSCSPGDFAAYGFNSPEAMRPQVKSLEDANLLSSTIDDDDKRRKTIALTSVGWLVRYARTTLDNSSGPG